MNHQATHFSVRESHGLVVFLLVMLSILFGVLSALLSPAIIVALFFLPVLIFITWSYSEIALLVLLAVLYGIVPKSLVPTIPVGGGSFQANDLALACLFFVIALRSLGNYSALLGALKPLILPLFLLGCLFFFSLFSSLAYFHNPLKHVLAEVRNFLYWLVLPITLLIVGGDRSKFNFISIGMVVLGYLISAGLIFQHFTGIDVLGSGRVEQLVTLDKTSDVVRTTSPGIYFVIFSIYYFMARWLSGRSQWAVAWLACMPLILGLLVTFGRGVWISAAIGLLILSLSLEKKAFVKLTLVGVVMFSFMSIGLFAVKPETGQAVADRLFSVAQEVQSGSSVEWRYLENKYAIDNLVKSPIVGVGMGGFAHPKFHPMMDDDLLRYVHNGYLYLAVKVGVLGFLVPIFVIFQVVKWLGTSVVLKEDDVSVTRKSLLAAFLVPCITSFTQPEWMVSTGVCFLALVLGLLLSSFCILAENK